MTQKLSSRCPLLTNQLSVTAKQCLESWVEKGGVLIGFKPEKLDDLFGITLNEYIKQLPDDYTISGYFSILD